MKATPEDAVMDSRQISMVKESFEKVRPFSNRLTRVFFDHLFELNPELRGLFKKDMREQRRKFIKSLTCIVENLHDADKIAPKLKSLARSHVFYNVKKEDYQTFGNALIFALSAALGDDFTPAIKSAWKVVYSTLAGIMINEAYK